ncbi:MAG TPA: hypothetical protein VMA83_08195 [Solirubrobacteraceae bacterium]|nr:hypothetical protein [Solirubrobacteraceae bacterium]
MKPSPKIAVAVAVACAALAAPGAAAAAQSTNTVFVQNDNKAGNQVVAYHRASDGTLTQTGVFGAGGLGGQLEGSVADHLGSQGSLAYDGADNLLFAVNAGSDTVAVFGVHGSRLALRQDISSYGEFPVSVTAGDGRLYVLDAAGGGTVQGYAIRDGRLVAIAGAHLNLDLPEEAPQFVHTPGDISLEPGGANLIVTTKATTNSVDVIPVGLDGSLSAPVVNEEPGTVPFAVAYDREGHVLVAEAGGYLAAFEAAESGELRQLDSVATNQAATCWLTEARGHFYTSNAGSSTLTAFSSADGGNVLTDLGNTETDAGTVDAAAVPGGRFLYVQTGVAGNVDEFEVAHSGALTRIGSVTVPGAAGGEGVAVG